MTSQPRDLRPTCAKCGSPDVQEIGWTAYREDGTAYVVQDECPFPQNWCPDCGDTELSYPDQTRDDYRRAEHNDAAREAGPELLAACRSAADVLSREGADGLPLVIEALRQAIAHAEGREHA